MTDHAIERLRERYAVEATADDISEACAVILRGGAVLLGRRRGAARYLVVICGMVVQAVFKGGTLVTVEPRGKFCHGSRKKVSKARFTVRSKPHRYRRFARDA